MQRKVDWVDAQRCRARRTAHGWVESWSRGQKSQRASSACSGGVSAVMGTSDFDAHTFAQHSSFAIGVKAHCPPQQNLRQWKRRAYRPQQWSRLSTNYCDDLKRSTKAINCRDHQRQRLSPHPHQVSAQDANHWTKSHGISYSDRCDPIPKRPSLCQGLA